MPDRCICPPYEGDGDPGTNPACRKHGPIKNVNQSPFSQKSVHDQLIHLLAAQLELEVPTVHANGLSASKWRSVHTEGPGSSEYGITLYAEEPNRIAVPQLGWTSPRRARIIALHLLVAADEVDDVQG